MVRIVPHLVLKVKHFKLPKVLVKYPDNQTCYRLLSKLITNDYNYFQSYD